MSDISKVQAIDGSDTMLGRIKLRRDRALNAARELQDVIDLLEANPSAEKVLQYAAELWRTGDRL